MVDRPLGCRYNKKKNYIGVDTDFILNDNLGQL